MPERSKWPIFLVLVLTIVWAATMQSQIGSVLSAPFSNPGSCYFTDNILGLELARSSECFAGVVERGAESNIATNARAFRLNTYMDFAFILLYWAVFFLFAGKFDNRLSIWVIGFISAAALFDVLEDWRILRCLSELAGTKSIQGMLPWGFSLTKWIFLALALGCSGVAVWSSAIGGRRLLSPLLLAAGIFTLASAVLPGASRYATLFLGLVLIFMLVSFLPYSKDEVVVGIEYAYLLRFQLVAALILAVALPSAYHFIPSLFIGLFDGRGFLSFAFIVWAAFQLAWSIMVTFRLVLVYGPDRFDVPKAPQKTLSGSEQNSPPGAQHPEPLQNDVPRVRPVGAGTVAGFGLLAIPLVAVLFYGTPAPQWEGKLLAAFSGLVAALVVLLATASLQFFIEDKDGKTAESVFPTFRLLRKRSRPHKTLVWRIAASLLSYLPDHLKKGILNDDGHLRSGHEMSAIVLFIFVVIYLIVGRYFSPSHGHPGSQPAALFFLLFMLTVFTWFLSGAAFFLDRMRLPVWSTVLAVSLVTGSLQIGPLGTDHTYATPQSGYGRAEEIRPFNVIHDWEKGPRFKEQKTITIVATAGGGIRAAAWTAEVITRLQERCKEKLSSSLLLVSSVSGGSVGSMFVVDPFDSRNGDYPTSDTDLDPIRTNASRSSLSAVGWGLAYPDLARTAPVVGPLLFREGKGYDRGWALEHAWSAAWKDQEQPLMSDWRADVIAGTRPAVIFNATASESGERFLISSSEAKPTTGTAGSEQFFNLFPESDINVPTAARLSATFPYVSPLARPAMTKIETAYHVGDGGYYDNSGLLSVVEWLSDVGDSLRDYHVLLIVVDARPGEIAQGSKWSWQRQIVGPIGTLLSVRTNSQQLRDELELRMAISYLDTLNVKVTPAKFLFATESPVPLSWHLTKGQLEEIGKSWNRDNNESKDTVSRMLGCDYVKDAHSR